MKIAICDDERMYRYEIGRIIEQYMEEKGIVFQIKLFESGIEMLEDEEDISSYGIVFLDVNMREMDGIQIAEQIRNYSEDLYIVFVTSYIDYSIQGYRVNAIRYILKEQPQRLAASIKESLDAILKKIAVKRNAKSINFKFREGEKKISLSRIMYIESNIHDVKFIIKESTVCTYTMYGKLSIVEKEIEGEEFCRVHQSIVLNMGYIKKFIKDEIIMENGYIIHIPRTRLKMVKEAYTRFKGEEW